MLSNPLFKKLQTVFGNQIKTGVHLAPYTSARVGGPAEVLITVNSAIELAKAAQVLWGQEMPFIVIGGGSNILVSETGVNGVVILNRAKQVRFDTGGRPPEVCAESGANFGLIARQAAKKGLSGLEWAAGIPGTIGGAVIGNAGAHGGDMAGNLIMAEILHKERGAEYWPVDRMGFGYRWSALKSMSGESVILSATLKLEHSNKESIQEKMERYLSHRRRTQPPGASMGSMFKNPPGDYAGRLIDAAGLKGASVGCAQISELHGNFFVNKGNAGADEIRRLIDIAQQEVLRQFGIHLELEIELIGEWY